MLFKIVVMVGTHTMKCNHIHKFHNQQSYLLQSNFPIETECFPMIWFTRLSQWISINQEILQVNPKLKNHIMDTITWPKAAIKFHIWKAKNLHIHKLISHSPYQGRLRQTIQYRLKSKIIKYFQWIKKNTQAKPCMSH